MTPAMTATTRPTQRFLAPEVVQTSAMDCGPATLKCLLEGFGVAASYGRLREACQTDVDGTSIDTIEDVAQQLGLHAEQLLLPEDHLLLPAAEALPALVVARLPSGAPHFVVAWNCVGTFVQVMDPAHGRRWLTQQQFLAMLHPHSLLLSTTAWRDWALTAGFQAPLHTRLTQLVGSAPEAQTLLESAAADPTWRSLAGLDAAARMAATLARARALQRGPELHRFLASLLQQVQHSGDTDLRSLIPARYWRAHPAQTPDDSLVLSGAVIVRVRGRLERTAGQPLPSPDSPSPDRPLSPQLAAALTEAPIHPLSELWRIIRSDGLWTPAAVGVALPLASAAVLIEAFLLRGLIQIGSRPELAGTQQMLWLAVPLFAVVMLLLEIPIAAATLHMGRHLETRLRIALLAKMPRLNHRYFHSRLLSDLAGHAHSLRSIRTAPELGIRLLRTGFQLLLTTLGLVLLSPASLLPALLAAATALVGSWLTQPLLNELGARVSTQSSVLSRFYLDGLLGLVPLRAHGAERALRSGHEERLVAWMRASLHYFDLATLFHAGQTLLSTLCTIWIVLAYLTYNGEVDGVLLLLYWALTLPTLATTLADLTRQYPHHHTRMIRLTEPLRAPDEEANSPAAQPARPIDTIPAALEPLTGVAVHLHAASVTAGGHSILHNVTLTLQSNEHVAIAGASGAGKSTLAGLLLGWHRPISGSVQIDGNELTPATLPALRRTTAWIDPAVQLWNRSLLENLRYGNLTDRAPLSDILELADLYRLIERLPNGLQSPLGEGGALLSGGEGQRVRLGRALFRPGVRLAILDEPFRGLDRSQRRELLTRARQHWRQSTLICITHDISETRSFDRVLVVDQGRIVEDDRPAALAARPDSHYSALLAAEQAVRTTLWEGAAWRRLWIEEGRLQEAPPSTHPRPAN